jgi:type IV secretory pathway VirB3-like protein
MLFEIISSYLKTFFTIVIWFTIVFLASTYPLLLLIPLVILICGAYIFALKEQKFLGVMLILYGLACAIGSLLFPVYATV